MFLSSITGGDERFRTVQFRDGLNLLVSDRTPESEQTDSRNGAGKTSLARLVRFLMGGTRRGALTSTALGDHCFTAHFGDAAAATPGQAASVQRCGTSTRISATEFDEGIFTVDEWKRWQAEHWFHLDPKLNPWSIGNLWAHLVRTELDSATKAVPNEAKWRTSLRMGHFLGVQHRALEHGAEAAETRRVRKALKNAMKDGHVPGLPDNPGELRPALATAERRLRAAKDRLAGYRVDEQYEQHQSRADALSSEIKQANERIAALRADARRVERAIVESELSAPDEELAARLDATYAAQQFALPETALRRFEDVAAFHASIVRNRRNRLETSLIALREEERQLTDSVKDMDFQRAELLVLLDQTQALDTYNEAVQSLAAMKEDVARLQGQLSLANQLSTADAELRAAEATAALDVERALSDVASLDDTLGRYDSLIREIYTDRGGALRIEASREGLLTVDATIDGDTSKGINGVKIFVLDTVLLISAIHHGRAPRFLMHDSHLFDAMDDRQAASCLNIGARLAEEFGYQYVVTLNSDKLASIEREQGDRADQRFDGTPYSISPTLTDREESGGLFGFRFV